MKFNYRNSARTHAANARNFLDAELSLESVRYAALELRMALESLVYERATKYLGELHGASYKSWQPAKVFAEMLEVDPDVPQGTATISFGLEERYGEPAKPTHAMVENSISTKDLNRHYHALGSFLHSPTIAQLDSGVVISAKAISARCQEALDVVEKALQSTAFNVDFRVTKNWDCKRCSHTNSARVLTMQPGDERVVKCTECGSPHKLECVKEDLWSIQPMYYQGVPCPAQSCNHQTPIWEDQSHHNSTFSCGACRTEIRLVLGVRLANDLDLS